MKKLLIPFIFLVLCLPGLAKGWVYVHGTVTDIDHGYPIPNQAVTIMSDSLNGVLYYNTVYTDSVGVYFDDIPVMADSTGMVYIQTIDCQDYLHQVVIYLNPNTNNYTQDFQICYSFSTCQAYFSYNPYPQGSPDSFQFNDQSTGNIIAWAWSFGDGTGSDQQNPLHSYPGPGTYAACLTITGNNCTDSYCQDIVISDTVYHQLYGQVFAGNFPLKSGSVTLFAMNTNGGYSPFDEAYQIDSNGVYYFSLVPDGIYLIHAVPFDSGNYIPTYFGNVINWQSATQLILGMPDNPYNINMVMTGQMTPGPGSVSGLINNTGLKSTSVDKIDMILMNENDTAIGFSRVSNSGDFDFPSLDYGTYYLRAELAGISSDIVKIEITTEKPHVDVFLNFSGNSILGLEEHNSPEGSVSVYPNPVENQLNILLELPGSSKGEIEIFTISGQKIYSVSKSLNKGENTFSIRFDDFPEGLFILRIVTENGINIVQKILK